MATVLVICIILMCLFILALNSAPKVAWDGYVAATSFNNPAPQVTYVNGSWIVPEVHPSWLAKAIYSTWDSKEWVGIGGYDSGPSIVQLGTETSYYGQNSTLAYYAWYEYFNSSFGSNPANGKIRIKNFTVQPGDVMYAEVKCIDNCMSTPQRWSILLDDATRGESFQNISTFNAVNTWAEWIVELDPMVDIRSFILINRTPTYFGQVYTHIDSDYATIGGNTESIGLSDYNLSSQSGIEHVSNLSNGTGFFVK